MTRAKEISLWERSCPNLQEKASGPESKMTEDREVGALRFPRKDRGYRPSQGKGREHDAVP